MAKQEVGPVETEQVVNAVAMSCRLGYDGWRFVNNSLVIADYARAGILSSSIVGAEVVSDASTGLIFNTLSYTALLEGVTNAARFWASSRGLLSIATGAYDIYCGINDMTDCSDAQKFRKLREELERQRDQIIEYQDMVTEMCRNRQK